MQQMLEYQNARLQGQALLIQLPGSIKLLALHMASSQTCQQQRVLRSFDKGSGQQRQRGIHISQQQMHCGEIDPRIQIERRYVQHRQRMPRRQDIAKVRTGKRQEYMLSQSLWRR
ncbi:hypothetical protein NW939_12290 [Aeromonas caviae]|nr:hypothetical protein [Aeromonas caviae]MCR9025389.1 hypothetical protein [Aeromonas caviae]